MPLPRSCRLTSGGLDSNQQLGGKPPRVSYLSYHPVNNSILHGCAADVKRLSEDETAKAHERPRFTLTNLYNDPPRWLERAHAEFDRPSSTRTDGPKTLARLLELNLARDAA